LGLSTSHDIIAKHHGGRIEIENEAFEIQEIQIVPPRIGTASNKNWGQA